MKKTTRDLLALQLALVRCAAQGAGLNYQKVSDAAKLGLDMRAGGPPHRRRMGHLLGGLVEADAYARRPLLSVLCVNKSADRKRGVEAGYPGPGFYEAAETAGLFDPKTDDAKKFADRETRRVIKYWKKRLGVP